MSKAETRTQLSRLELPPTPRLVGATAALTPLVGGASALAVSAANVRAGFALAVATAAVTAIAASLSSWRWPIYALVLYLPVSGIPILALYPETDVAVLLKDFLFVIPAYVAFLVYAYRTRTRISFPGAPTALLVMLAVLVGLQALNPALPSALVGAIGVKVWLFYVPLYFLAYHLVRDRRELGRLLMLIGAGALLPAAVGLVEAVLYRAGEANFVYRLYGDAGWPATQYYTALELPGGATVRRVPSTFSSWTQYYAFTLTMTAVAYAWWRSAPPRTQLARVALVAWLASAAAALTSGARVAFIAIPALLLATFFLERLPWRPGTRRKVGLIRMAAPVAVIVSAIVLLGAGARDVVSEIAWKARLEVSDTFLGKVHQATDVTWTGLGTGIDTIGARYAFSDRQRFDVLGGSWYESWYAKLVLELGIPGLVLVAMLLGVIVVRAVRSHLRLADPGLKVVSAAIVAYLILTIAAGTGKPYIDYDPINVYFWFLAGLLAKLPVLERAEPRSA